jgi:hypothetical protein
MRKKLSTITTIGGAALALLSAVSMRDQVRLVEIITLFFGGLGAGAGLAGLWAARRAAQRRTPSLADPSTPTPPLSPSRKEPI